MFHSQLGGLPISLVRPGERKDVGIGCIDIVEIGAALTPNGTTMYPPAYQDRYGNPNICRAFSRISPLAFRIICGPEIIPGHHYVAKTHNNKHGFYLGRRRPHHRHSGSWRGGPTRLLGGGVVLRLLCPLWCDRT